MCDTLAVVGPEGTWFAKNSDRPIGEAQVVEWHPRRRGGSALRTTHVEIEDRGSLALIGSRPVWCWGLEHGVNEHGVAAGNERLWTSDDPAGEPPGLIGMDLVRLALERASSAEQAVDVITDLLETHGQGGSCAGDHDDPYWSSFLIADPTTAYVLETSGRSWVVKPAPSGAAISNRITLSTDWSLSSGDVGVGEDFSARNDALGPAVSDRRLAVTTQEVRRGTPPVGASSLAGLLRHHGTRSWGFPDRSTPPGDDVTAPPSDLGDDMSGVTVCQHVPGVAVTAASMIAFLPTRQATPPSAWAALASPCTSVFVPLAWGDVPEQMARASVWERFDDLRQHVEHEPESLAVVRRTLGPVERELWRAARLPHAGDSFEAVAAALDELGV